MEIPLPLPEAILQHQNIYPGPHPQVMSNRNHHQWTSRIVQIIFYPDRAFNFETFNQLFGRKFGLIRISARGPGLNFMKIVPKCIYTFRSLSPTSEASREVENLT